MLGKSNAFVRVCLRRKVPATVIIATTVIAVSEKQAVLDC